MSEADPADEDFALQPETDPGSPDLQTALSAAGEALPDDQAAQLEQYARLLWEWNDKLNLTRHITWDKLVTRDLLDSRKLEELLDAGERVLDWGTGGGVPGVILAILRPDLEITLCDSVAKKARAVADIVTRMDLPITVRHAPGQAVLAETEFDTIVCRAVAPLGKLLTWWGPYWEQFQQALVIKGPAWRTELAEAKQNRQTRGVQIEPMTEYPLAGTDSQSVILRIRRG